LLDQLLQGVRTMKESVTYQAIIQEGQAVGEIKEARKLLLLLGRSHLGEPSSEVLAAVDAISDLQKLEALTLRVHQAASWQELLGSNGRVRRGRSRK
jgi:hypothetical protein